jgi:membrane fusion protein, multidrug efflux system
MNRIILNTIYPVFLLVTILSACKSHKPAGQAGAPVPVVPFTVQSGNLVYYDTYPGTVVATDEVQLRSEVSGFVTGIYFKEGGEVKKGAKLYEIDRRKFQAAYDEAKAALEIANANLEKARRDADRYKKLDEENAIAKQVLDDALTMFANAQMQVRSSKANLVNAQTDFIYSLITAPFTGSIGLSLVKPGAFVTAGQTLLNTISSDDPIAIDFIIDEKSLPYIVKLQNLKTSAQDSTFKVTLADNSDYKHRGNLSIIDRAVDPQTGTIKIRTVFPNPERTLRPGMNCKVKVLNNYSGMQISIPAKALVEQMGEYFVYKIDSGNIIKQKRVQLGPAQEDKVVVKTGLNPGDKIVVEGIQKVHEGSSVTMTSSLDKNKREQVGGDQKKEVRSKKDRPSTDSNKQDKGKGTE